MNARRAAFVVAATIGLALSGAGVSHAEPGGAGTGEYVALGDSYVAGPLIPAPTGQPVGCLRSDHNYPSLVQAGLRSPRFRDVSCGGATTKDMTAPQQVTGGVNPPQLDALSARTTLVTLGIGGNDIGFGDIVTDCGTRSPTQPLGAACRDHYTQGGHDQLAERIAKTAPKVAAVLQAIDKRAPGAKVLLVGYPTILPDSGPGCFPVVPFSAGDVAYLRATEKSLNAMLARQAGRAGVEFVDTYASSVGHDICQLPGTKWVEGLVPTSPAAPVHPNALGMRNSANRVLSALHASAGS
ncbi:SGNH/GDSL hydrolase family protein [Pseudonocardia acaciae]|uniref:SGNH/GDSL hydrolase family protein n=1 Tax=Pseudonocardia acaciae TaxID=551276 RepID=UPI0004905BCE|nr:SGNH/GDSL hydrolase family protein [Pseudonocardia acaciae]